jgi:hypothetical protein
MRKIALFAVMMLFAGTALANRCPSEWKKIDDAMAKNPKLSATQMADVKKARAESETFHKAGKHSEAMAEADKAKKILELK